MRINGLYGWIRHNDARAAFLLAGFVVTIQLLACLVLFVPLLYFDLHHAPVYYWSGYCSRYVPSLVVASAGVFAIQMWRHVKTVRRQAVFNFVDNRDESRLCKIIEPLAITAGISAPFLAVIDSPAMNAFACGISEATGVIVVTRGLIDGLDDDELAGVIAHELVHIRNGDIRLMAAANIFMSNLGALQRINVLSVRSYWQIMPLLVVPMLFPLFMGAALLAQFCMRLGYASRLTVSSSREFVADAEAIRLTQNPAALISALQRIEGHSVVSGLPPQFDAMMIDGATMGSLATHPTIGERVNVIASLVGPLALETVRHRDTRPLPSAAAARGFGRHGATKETTASAQTTLCLPPLSSLVRVGADGKIGVFGIRWDLSVAVFATFGAGLVMNGGDLTGYLSKMGSFYQRSNADQMWFVDHASKCSAAQREALLGQTPNEADCQISPEFLARAKANGLTITRDGRILSASEAAMLSPQDLNAASSQAQSLFTADALHELGATAKASGAEATGAVSADFPTSVPLPVHETFLRLINGDVSRYLAAEQCGILIHAHVSSELDKAVVWRITSEGEERVRFTVSLASASPTRTRLALAIKDSQPVTEVTIGGEPNRRAEAMVLRPALRPPLRPTFAEALSAMLDRRPFNSDRILIDQPSEDPQTINICQSQGERLAEGSAHFSIHDPINSQ